MTSHWLLELRGLSVNIVMMTSSPVTEWMLLVFMWLRSVNKFIKMTQILHADNHQQFKVTTISQICPCKSCGNSRNSFSYLHDLLSPAWSQPAYFTWMTQSSQVDRLEWRKRKPFVGHGIHHGIDRTFQLTHILLWSYFLFQAINIWHEKNCPL